MNILGIMLPMGQSKKLLIESGQWQLWEGELKEYNKQFDHIELFEYHFNDWRRYIEVLFYPLLQKSRMCRCSMLKAVHLTGAIPCLLAKLFYGKKFLFSFGYHYDQFALVERKYFQWIFAKLFLPIAMRGADIVMVPTEELKKYARGHGAKKVEIIPNGVDTELFKDRPLDIKGSTFPDKKNITILFVGRLERQKNLETLIRAVHEISTNIKLVFVGSGSLKEEFLLLAKKLKVYLEIKKPVPHGRLSDIYHQADIFVLPSLVEGHPKVLLEAMVCELPCVASDIPGARDIITHNKDGFLVEPTVIGVSGGINRLILDSQLRQKLGREARKTIEEKYNKQKLIVKEIRLLKSLKRPTLSTQGWSLRN